MELAIFCLRNLLQVVKQLKIEGNQIVDEVIVLKKDIDVEFERLIKTKGCRDVVTVSQTEEKVVVHNLQSVDISTKFMKSWFKNELEIEIDVIGVSPWGKHTRIVSLSSKKDKSAIFRNCHRLKGKRIGITDDLPEEDRMQRRSLLPELMKIKNADKIAHFKGIRLITKEKETFQPNSNEPKGIA